MKNMLPAIWQLSTLLTCFLRCIFCHGPSDLLALFQSTWDWRSVNSPWVSEAVVVQWQCQFWPPPNCTRLWIANHLGRCIQSSCIIFSPDCIPQTLYSGTQCLGSMLFNHCIILWILRLTWKLPHHLKIPNIDWMKSWRRRCFEFESNSHFYHQMQSNTIFALIVTRLIKNPNSP